MTAALVVLAPRPIRPAPTDRGKIGIPTWGRPCIWCGKIRAWQQFYRKRNGWRGYTSECKPCRTAWARARREEINTYVREWRRANPGPAHAAQMRYSYGLPHGEYDRLLAEQGGVCAVCRKPETVKIKGKIRRLSVDHDHVTKAVRGLLCNSCNRTIGASREDVDRLRACADYLTASEELQCAS